MFYGKNLFYYVLWRLGARWATLGQFFFRLSHILRKLNKSGWPNGDFLKNILLFVKNLFSWYIMCCGENGARWATLGTIVLCLSYISRNVNIFPGWPPWTLQEMSETNDFMVYYMVWRVGVRWATLGQLYSVCLIFFRNVNIFFWAVHWGLFKKCVTNLMECLVMWQVGSWLGTP